MRIKNYISPLLPHDIVVIVFSVFLIVVNIIFCERIEHWSILTGLNIFVIAFVVIIANLSESERNSIIKNIRIWYIAPMVLLTFKQLYFMIAPIHGKDYDDLLIEIDRLLFGVDPTVWLSKFATPVLTEVIQIAYSSFYFLFIVAGYELYRKGEMGKFYFSAFLVVYGFYLSYIGYFFLPAVGPRFTLHNFATLNTELPGLFVTNFLRDFVNYGESIVKGHPNPAEIVQRDIFPSGHTQMTLVLLYITKKYKMKTTGFIWTTGILLIFGTVYLRYHYVIDLIAGALFMLLTVWSANYVYEGWNVMRQRLSLNPLYKSSRRPSAD